MLIRHTLILLSICSLLSSAAAGPGASRSRWKDTTLSVEKRVKSLLAEMTIGEKIAQLQCAIKEGPGTDSLIARGLGSLACPLRPLGPAEAAAKANAIQQRAMEKTRLGIPVLIHDEGLHGLIGRNATSFPQAIGLAATWDPDLVHRVANVIASQAKARGVRQLLSPVLNIARDVRWGRVEETYGEDPFLTSAMGVAFCSALEDHGVISTPKHFAANVGDGGRDSHPVHFSEELLREIYFPAFKACMTKARATSLMAAYNSINGVPCSADKWLLTDVLRKEWKFSGFVVSDYGSVGGILDLHHAATDKRDAARLALTAGLDSELPGAYIYVDSLADAVARKLIPAEAIDSSVARILRAKFRTGLFDHPLTDPDAAARGNDTPDDRQLARQAGRESIVLLRNEHQILPLDSKVRTLAVLGPMADSRVLGGYSSSGTHVVSILDGIRAAVGPTTTVRYAKGCDISAAPLPAVPPTFFTPPGPPAGEHGLQAEYFSNMTLSGAPSLVRTDPQINFSWGEGAPDSTLPQDHFSVRWTGTLHPDKTRRYKFGITTDDGVRLYIDGKLLVDSWVDRGPTTDYTVVKLDSGRTYDLRVEYYENTGGAVASLGWAVPDTSSREIRDAVEAARGADAAVVAVGINEGEGQDRSDIGLPGRQAELISAVASTGVPVIVVVMAGSAVTMHPWIDDAAGILDVWYGGEECGNAVADILFGAANPGGKLPITFPQSVGQVPLYYNSKPSGRGYDYVDLSGNPLFPFGYGLSYTTFDYSNLMVSPAVIRPGDSVVVSLNVTNTGSRSGDEVVQLYLHSTVSGMSRPLKELKGFRRIGLPPGGSSGVRFVLGAEELELPDGRNRDRVFPGLYEIQVGGSSADARLGGRFTVAERKGKR